MLLWCAGLAWADPITTFRAETASLGASPLTFELRETGDGRAVAELHWDVFDRVTIEAVVDVHDGCAGDALEVGRGKIDAPCRSIDARVKDPHPVYGYVSDTRLRCVLGADDGPVAWCKLNYTAWFEARPVL